MIIVSHVILHLNAQDVLRRRREREGHDADVEHISAPVYLFIRRVGADTVLILFHRVKIPDIIRRVLVPDKPETICKFHTNLHSAAFSGGTVLFSCIPPDRPALRFP